MHFRYISIVGIFSLFFGLAGCQKNASPTVATDQSVASVDVHADENTTETNEVEIALRDVIAFFNGLDKVADAAGDDCTKVGTDMNKYLDDNKEKFVASMKIVGNLADDDAENFKDELEKATGDDAPHSRVLEKCEDNKEVEAFGIAFLNALTAASTIEEELENQDDEAAMKKALEEAIAAKEAEEAAALQAEMEIERKLAAHRTTSEKFESTGQPTPNKNELVAALKLTNEKAKHCGKDGTLRINFSLSNNVATHVVVVGGSLEGTETEKCLLPIIQEYNWPDGTANSIGYTYKF